MPPHQDGLEHYCWELNGWPRSWMGLEKDFPPGEHLVTLFSSFLDHLAPENLSPKRRSRNTSIPVQIGPLNIERNENGVDFSYADDSSRFRDFGCFRSAC
jgi:hypothetical protein